ncbi:MAG: ATP-binding protein, partial [Deltaproteobacteria bacterium]|nr:ATP-binding protein [Deltaproteobacteria bacterium]
MTNPAAITVFGVLGAPGVELSHLADPMAAASAVDEADVLSAETLSFFEAGPAPGELADLYQTYQTAMEEKNQDRMSEQKERIARRMRSLSEPQWQAMIRRAQLFGQNKFHCFAAAIANAGIAHQIQTIERDTAEGKNLHEAKKTLCRIAAMAAFGDANAWNTLCAIADGESSMALTAVVLVERREELVSLAAAPDRLTFARIANALLQREYDKILEDLLAGRAQPDNRLARRLEILSNGLDSFLNAIDDIKAKAIADWRKNHEANILLHDGVGRILLHFQITSTWMSEGNIKSLNAMAFAGLGSEFELLGLARTAVLKNALGIAAKGIEVRIDLPQGIEIVKGQTDNLVASLVELIHNAVKYAVDSKPEKWIHIDWHPLERALTVSDNGLGIQDTEAVWEGRREHTEGEGHGLAIVRKRLEADRWKGKVISVPGEVTTFKLLAPVGAVVYSEDHLKGELKHQRDEFRDKGVFDFSRLSAELLSQMTPEEQLEAGKEAVAELEAATHRIYDSVQNLKADDLTGFKELIRHHYIFYKAILRLREEAKIEPAVAGLFNNLFSSVIQMLSGMEQVHNGYRKIKNGKIPWEESIQAIPNPYAWVERSLTKGDFVLTYQAPHS